MHARGSCSHRIFSSAGLNRICVVLKLREGFLDLSLNCLLFFFRLGNIKNTNFREALQCTVAYTEPDTKTNSPSCWKNYVQDFTLLCPLWLKWRTFPNRVYVCVFVRDLAESLGAGRWTAWLWRERTMAWLYPSIQSLCRPSDSWAADPPSLPLLRISSGNMAHTFCFQLHSEVFEQSCLFISKEFHHFHWKINTYSFDVSW